MKEAVVCIIKNEKEEYLFLDRNFEPRGKCLAGEKIEESDTNPFDAVRREVEEEVGFKIFNPMFIGSYPSVTGRKVLIFYTVVDSKTSKVKLSPEHSAFEWLKIENVPENYEWAGNTKHFMIEFFNKKRQIESEVES